MKTTPRDYTMKYESVNPLEKLHSGEPYFFLRAQDRLSLVAIYAYRDALKEASARAFIDGTQHESDELIKGALGVLRVIEKFYEWQDANPDKVKLPDGIKVKDRPAASDERKGT